MVDIIRNLPEHEYHQQTGITDPLFSYSIAKTIIQKSAYHAFRVHPLLGNAEKKTSRAMDKGSLIHSLVLGKGSDIVVIEADSFRTNAAKEKRDEAYADGKTPILKREMEEYKKAVKWIHHQIGDLVPDFFDDHETELTVRWRTDDGVLCQSRFDWINPATGKIRDIKTTTDASPQKVERKIIDMGYDIQQAMYMMCAEKAWLDMAGRFQWEFIFIETEEPYLVSAVTTDNIMLWLGESKMNRAAAIWKECLESGRWPGYGKHMITTPSWAVKKEEMED